MELLDGETLSARLSSSGALGYDQALDIARQLCSALTEAHLSGVIHRDLKSGNVILCRSGDGTRAVITDFGLATETALDPRDLAGTPAYMAPELWRGERPSKASDIYALGVILYEMVTGVKPFTDQKTESRLTCQPVAPSTWTKGLDSRWDAAILRCLDPSPAARPQDARDVLALLERRPLSRLIGKLAAAWTPANATTRRVRRTVAVFVMAALVVGAVTLARRFTVVSRSASPKLTEKDTIVLSEFHNTTGDAVFDETLKQGLSVALNQSPFLNVLSDARVAETLKLMSRPDGTKLTPDVARELCQRAGSKAYIAGSIANLGSQYVLGLEAVNCQTGDALVQEQITAAAKEKVLDALGEATAKLRGELGESLATVQKFNVPLEQATTPSLEALKAYTLGRKDSYPEGSVAALTYLQRAVQLDPNFAMGYWGLGQYYFTYGEDGASIEYFTKAFELRERAGEREKLAITGAYYRIVTGELEKAAQTYQQWIESYPRDKQGHVYLGHVYAELGQYEKARDALREYFRDHGTPDDGNLCYTLLALQRFDEARQGILQAQAVKLDNLDLRTCLYAMAFVAKDSSAIAEQQRWFASNADDGALSFVADTAAYAGRLSEARELTRQSIQAAIRGDFIETGAIFEDNGALREAAFGNAPEANQAAAAALKIAPANKDVKIEAALAFAMAGDAARAQSLARDLNKHYPLDTQIQSLWLPAIQAQLALDRKNPADALKILQAAAPVELGQIHWVANVSCLYPTYIRGEAHLAARQGNAAAIEFQKIVDHSGIVWNCWTGALAQLGLARANALQAQTLQGADAEAARARALAAYKDFLTLWKDADPGIPILKQAKAEFSKLNRVR
jgi:Tfp pilus assembly protein PilF